MGGKRKMFIYGGIIGLIAAILMKMGNPGNMGICVACFYRDIAGAVGLHRAEVVQYIRPEIIGFIFGAFIISIVKRDFKSRGGSSTLIRFFLGFFLVIGALVFLGCPLRMILRLANGDLNAIIGLVGYLVGIFIGIQFLKKGYTLGRSIEQNKISGYIVPTMAVVLLIFLVIKPAFIFFSTEGPGSMKAPVILSLVLGMVVGAVLQRSRICTAGGFRDAMLIKDYHFLWGIIGIFIVNLIANLILNFDSFHIGFADQPVAHSNHLWNFLSMTLAGLCSVLLGGCPVRQTILASEGDTDAGVTILGVIVGAAFSHNFDLASSPKGATPNGKIAVIIGIVFVLILAYGIIKNNNKIKSQNKEVIKNA
ncbi:YedE-related selenium metabolism membrane protein [Tissierella sp. MSJ-40]|uniref:YedE-related selenium metabolism membrane protein n=1 Tax=Tissierella simiarum TaxID=2841534 RepID=A0ABS6E6M1_9FIRM|nr:YedE family putative selenium transporter [Tissierella simiarum]MBU5438573.1 YedE-related selenium metabolism membrane protein [Tissierella simiarum]